MGVVSGKVEPLVGKFIGDGEMVKVIRQKLMSELNKADSSDEAVAWAEALKSFEIAVKIKFERELLQTPAAG